MGGHPKSDRNSIFNSGLPHTKAQILPSLPSTLLKNRKRGAVGHGFLGCSEFLGVTLLTLCPSSALIRDCDSGNGASEPVSSL